MGDSPQPNKSGQEHEFARHVIDGLRRIAVAIEVQSKTDEQQSLSGREPARPLFVQEVSGNDLKPFEKESLAISRETLAVNRRPYWIALFGFLAALAAATFVGVQVKIMSYQTQVMASQTESAIAGASVGEMNTRKQLAIAQQQADSASRSVDALQRQATTARQLAQEDRRPWVGVKEFECGKCTSEPIENVLNEPKFPVTVEDFTLDDMSIILDNSGRTPALKMNFSSLSPVVQSKRAPIPDYDRIVAATPPNSVPPQFSEQIKIFKKFTGAIATVLPPNSIRKMRMPEKMFGTRRLDVAIPEQVVTYVLGRVTYYGPERRQQYVTNFCLMNDTGVEFRYCPTGNDMK